MTDVDGLILNLQQNATCPLARDEFKMSEGELENVSDSGNFTTTYVIDFLNRPT